MFLGYVVTAQGIKMDEEKVKAVRDWPTTKSVNKVCSFIYFGCQVSRILNTKELYKDDSDFANVYNACETSASRKFYR